jgi:hypothetical protein
MPLRRIPRAPADCLGRRASAAQATTSNQPGGLIMSSTVAVAGGSGKLGLSTFHISQQLRDC